MAMQDPVAELQTQFSSAGAPPTPWAEARGHLDPAEVLCLSSVRPDGPPRHKPRIPLRLKGSL